MSYMPYTSAQTTALRNGVMHRVYAWMTAGLLVTGAVASYVANSAELTSLIFGNPLMFFGLFIVQIIAVIGLSAGINRMSPAMAMAIFTGYAALNGLTLAAIFLVYTSASIASTFFITAGTFGAMSLYGFTTKRDLSGVGNIAIMALIGILIASIVNIFLRSSGLYWVITYIGVLVFVALTAWDTQKIKHMSQQVSDEASAGRVAVIGALMLYLDFINLFIYLLRIFGVRRD
ncbi:MAG TPA: Bax inhibitor-1/YccA family protein [Roseiflexaceae bacterium]|nr:Bax inhibitor-1/YccA family protein [Roseiflexaceae bacterium]